MGETPVEVGRLAAADLPALAELYRAFWGDDSSLAATSATFARRGDDADDVFVAARRCASIMFITESERQAAVRFHESLGDERAPYRGT